MREDLEKLLNIYAIEERCFSYVLQKHTILPALIDTGEEHIDFFDEWFYAKPHLVRLAENVSTIPAGATKAEARVICNRADFCFTGGWDAFETFLRLYGGEFGRVAALIRIMLVIASNSSIIERGHVALKGIKSHKRSRLEDDQLERLLILSVNLPELSDFDIQSVVAGMPSSWYRRVQGNNFLGFYLVIFQNLYFLKLL